MPELPDVVVYVEAIAERTLGQPLVGVRIKSPFLLRSVSPRPAELEGAKVTSVRRLGKRIAIGVEGERFLVLHLMIAGRLHWYQPASEPVKLGQRNRLAAFDFASGSLLLTEAGTKKRASLHVVAGETELASHDRGGLEVLESSLQDFRPALQSENHTLKRSLTDPRLFSGIGNAFSDEILHRARLSPLRWTSRLDDEETERLYHACVEVLESWTERLRAEAAVRFPEKVTAFREGMAVHGRFGKPCPDCSAPVQRIVYAANECNYCARCQTGGKLLADRALSRLLRSDWPRTLEELEELHRR